MTPIPQHTDAEILETIEILNSPAHQRLSKIHAEYLEIIESLARTRNLKL